MIKQYNMQEDPNKGNNAAVLIGIIIICLLIMCTHRCSAQTSVKVDTMVCKIECIKKILEQPTSSGKSSRYFAVYVDDEAGFSEIIPVSKSVCGYINNCKAYKIHPNLGIVLKNGVISSIVRYKIKFKTK